MSDLGHVKSNLTKKQITISNQQRLSPTVHKFVNKIYFKVVTHK